MQVRLTKEIHNTKGVKWAAGTIVHVDCCPTHSPYEQGKRMLYIVSVAGPYNGPVLCDADWELVVPDHMEVK